MPRIKNRKTKTKYYYQNSRDVLNDKDIEIIKSRPYLFRAFCDIIDNANERGRESLFLKRVRGGNRKYSDVV